eukprot:m.34908 g.34908  ORF g.34908 m.34908 type:complete len:665 (+) comp8803_c0_seq1:68-2062(+)
MEFPTKMARGFVLVLVVAVAFLSYARADPLQCGASDIKQCHSAEGSMAPDNFTTSNATECCALCAQTPGCAGFIFRADSPKDKVNACHLKEPGYLHLCTSEEIGNSDNDCLPCGIVNTPPPPPPPPAPKGAKNVLFLVSDDFRPSTGAYGVQEVITPNLDKLAKDGILFTAVHTQFSYCAPSRNSFMSGRRPDATKVWNFNDNFREIGVGDKWTALPEHFKNSGYLVTGIGKLYHPGVPPRFDQPRSWSELAPDGSPWPYLDSGKVNKSNECAEKCCGSNDTAHYCLYDLKPNTYLLDQTVRNLVLQRLDVAVDNYKKTGQPFFVGMGTHRPHLMWEYPKSFYDASPVNVPEAKVKEWPVDTHPIGFHDCAEMSHAFVNTNGVGVPLGTDYWTGHEAEMRRAYYGCLSYVDDLLGSAVKMVDDNNLTDSTVVIWTSDHGWHLGEHDLWCKMTTLELGTRVPLIIRAPWRTTSPGSYSPALGELVDLYPTLVDLAGITMPTGVGGEYLTGVSLAPILEAKDPKTASVKNRTLSQFPRCWQNNTHHTGKSPGDERNYTNSFMSMSDCHWTDRAYINYMGYKMRTANMSITQWVVWNGTGLRPLWNEPVATELYSHIGDTGIAPMAFDDYENENLANNPDYADIKEKLLLELVALAESYMTPNPSTW